MSINDTPPIPKFQSATLIGGPHHGHVVRVPEDLDVVTFHDNTVPHKYLRLGLKAELHHHGRVEALLGGGK